MAVVHLAVHAALNGHTTARFKTLTRRREERRGRGDDPLLSLSSQGYLYARTHETDRQQASEEGLTRCLKVVPNDLVVNPMWLTGGSVGVSDKNGAVSPDYRVFSLAPSLDPRYVHHLLRSDPYLDQYRLYTRADTTFDRRVQQDDLDELPIPILPLQEQRRIADYLDAECARLDRLIELRRQQRTLNQERGRVALRAAVEALGVNVATGVAWLPLMASDWRVVPLKYVSRCLDARRIPLSATERAGMPGEYPYYGASTIVDYIDSYLFDDDLVLFGEDGAALENPESNVVQRVSGKCWVNNHAHVLRAASAVLVDYLTYYLRSADRWFLISGATRPKITQEDLMSLPIVIPPIATQRDLVSKVDTVAAVAERFDGALAQSRDLLRERKQALITAAVTCEFDVSTASGRGV